ncbi:MAG: energy transducer TonB [Candidatus Eisenbacteria bacterium]
MRRSRASILALALTLIPGPTAGAAGRDGEDTFHTALRARRDITLRSGERVRPRVVVGHGAAAPRFHLDLGSRRPPSSGAPPRLVGRIVVHGAGKDTLMTQAIAWAPAGEPGTYGIPDSSAWLVALDGGRRVTLLPDSAGPIPEPIEFEFTSSRPWAEVRASRPRSSPPPAPDFVFTEEMPHIIKRVPCPYPATVPVPRPEGAVVVHVLVGKDGRVAECKVVQSIPGLDEAALACVRQYRFAPGKSNEKPVAMWVAFPVRFSPE